MSEILKAASKLTAKGQTTIPSDVRELLDLKAGDVLDYSFRDGEVVLRKRRSALEFAGILHDPNRKPLSIEEMDEAIGEAINERYGQSRDRAIDDRD